MRSHQLSQLGRAALLSLTSAAFAFGAQAQSSNPGAARNADSYDARPSASASADAYRPVRADDVIGMKVRNSRGERLGEIGDLVVNISTGDVRYAILRFDPGIFSAERLFAVPTDELKLSADGRHVLYQMNREQLERTSINPSDWNSRFFNDPERTARLDRASGIVQPSDGSKARRASDLIGQNVQNRAGENVGEIQDLVVNMQNQKVHYAVLQFDPGWTTTEKQVVVPLRSFEVAQGRDNLVLNVDQSMARSMQDVSNNSADISNPVWVFDVNRYLVTFAPTSADGGGSSSAMGASGGQSAQGQGSQQMAQGEREQGFRWIQGQGTQRDTGAGADSIQSAQEMQKLQQSAQRLRESIQAMAQRPPGAERDRAIEQAHEALRETNGTMVLLIPVLRTAGADGSSPSQSEAQSESRAQSQLQSQASSQSPWQSQARAQQSPADYDRTLARLTRAADNLRQSIQAMAQQPAGESRNRAILEANQALWDTQQAMAYTYAAAHGLGTGSSQTMGASGDQQRQQGSR